MWLWRESRLRLAFPRPRDADVRSPLDALVSCTGSYYALLQVLFISVAFCPDVTSLTLSPQAVWHWHGRYVKIHTMEPSFTLSVLVDVWSIGCILAELLLGRPLFKGRE